MAHIDLGPRPLPTGRTRKATEDYALLPLKMSFADGGAYALLGPSGCGKTTLLNIISGLCHAVAGQRRFRRQGCHRPAAAAAQHRPGVPVSGHLRHHDGGREPRLSAAQPRRAERADPTKRVGGRGDARAERPARPARRGLTADAKQKISLGRGLVRDDVAAILFDEPLTVIDPHLKWQLRRKLKQIHQRSS